MREEQFMAELQYQLSLNFAKQLENAQLITENELTFIDEMIQDKYKPTLGTLFSVLNQK